MSSLENDVIKYKKALQQCLDGRKAEDAIDIMNSLAKIKATAELLRKTEIGKYLSKLRNHENAAVAQKSREIVKKWKDQVQPETKETAIKSSTSGTQSTQISNQKKIGNGRENQRAGPIEIVTTPQTPVTPETPATPSTPAGDRTIKIDNVTIATTGSLQRDKTIEALYAALGIGCLYDSTIILERATAIELAIYQKGNAINDEYKAKVRSLISNLKSKENPGLRESVLTGETPVKKLVVMTKEEMASEEKKAERRKLEEAAIFNSRGAGQVQAETDMFLCGKCKGRKTTYFQMQTRSADEPMTTFVTCVICGNRWKFC